MKTDIKKEIENLNFIKWLCLKKKKKKNIQIWNAFAQKSWYLYKRTYYCSIYFFQADTNINAAKPVQ